MKAIWKEFFRLKWGEIWNVIRRIPHFLLMFLYAMLAIIVIAVFFIVLSLILGFIVTLFTSTFTDIDMSTFSNYINIGTITITIIIFGSIFLLAIGYCVYGVVSWLRSNWKQAKKNVANRR